MSSLEASDTDDTSSCQQATPYQLHSVPGTSKSESEAFRQLSRFRQPAPFVAS
jgi:hypothetical protein